MLKTFSIYSVLILLLMTITTSMATDQVNYIVWGFIKGADRFPVEGCEVFLGLSGGKYLKCVTDKKGLYKFYSYYEFTDQINVIVASDGYKTISLKNAPIAYRQDYSYFPPKGFALETTSPIVYVGPYSECYHRYNCSYLKNSQRPAPMGYCLYMGMFPCERCNPGIGK